MSLQTELHKVFNPGLSSSGKHGGNISPQNNFLIFFGTSETWKDLFPHSWERRFLNLHRRMFCCKNICKPSFGLIPKIKCLYKYPSFCTQERSTFDSHGPADLKQENQRQTKSAPLSSLKPATCFEMSLTM